MVTNSVVKEKFVTIRPPMIETPSGNRSSDPVPLSSASGNADQLAASLTVRF